MKQKSTRKALVYKICLECPLTKCNGDCKRLRAERKKLRKVSVPA